MGRTDIAIFMAFLIVIVAWALLGPGGWVSGVVGALVGIVLGVGFVVARRRRSPSGR